MLRHFLFPSCLVATSLVFGTATAYADEPTAPPPHALPATVSASVGAGGMSTKIPAGAAVIDGHEISMDDLIAVCLKAGGPTMLDNMVNDYLVERECDRRHIVVPQSAVDARIERLRKRIAPTSLEEGLAAHHQTLAMVQAEIKKTLQREMLVVDQVKPTKMANCRAIFVAYTPPGMPIAPGGKARTPSEALTRARNIQSQLKTGKEFGAIATQYSDDDARDHGGNMGVVFEGINDMDTALLRAALTQTAGEISSEPIQTYNGYYLVQVISTGESHPDSENAIYDAADRNYKEQQAQFLFGPLLAGLRNKSKVTYNLPQ